MSLIDNLISMMAGMKPENISVHEERCVCIRNRNARCLKCVEVCTTGAIAYEANDLRVYPEKCIGCGTCANVCPTGALEVAGLTDEELTRAVKHSIRSTQGHPVLACQTAVDAFAAENGGRGKSLFSGKASGTSLDENAMVVVPCLGRIDESLLCGIAAYGAYDATLVCHHCESCAHAKGGAFVRKVVEDASGLVSAFGKDVPFRIGESFPDHVLLKGNEAPTDPALQADASSRRDAFRQIKDAGRQLVQESIDEAAGQTADAPEPVAYRKVDERTGTLAQFVPTRRTRLYNYLKHIGEPVVDEVQTRLVGKLSIDIDACTSCRMCAVFCPTGAITKVDEEGCFGIFHRPAACMQCRLCESLCRAKAITVESTIPIRQFMGQKGVLYEMPRPEWTPNRPDSIFNKIHHVIGDNLEMRAF